MPYSHAVDDLRARVTQILQNLNAADPRVRDELVAVVMAVVSVGAVVGRLAFSLLR